MIDQQLIIDTAMKLFKTQGVKSVPLDRLAKDLRTSKRTIYRHFENKTELLKACLMDYHLEVRSEDEDTINKAKNAIEAMGYMHQQIIKRNAEINPNFFNDIIHYYPGLLEDSYTKAGNYAHTNLYKIAQWGIKDGLFYEDLDVEVTTKTVMSLLKLLKDTEEFPAIDFSKERLTFGIMIPYMRGLCTPKGRLILDKVEELYRVSI